MAVSHNTKVLLILGILFVIVVVVFIVIFLFLRSRDSGDDNGGGGENGGGGGEGTDNGGDGGNGGGTNDPTQTCNYPGFNSLYDEPSLAPETELIPGQPINGNCTLPNDTSDPDNFTNFEPAPGIPNDQVGIAWVVKNNTDLTYDLVGIFFDDDSNVENYYYITHDFKGKGNSIVGWTDITLYYFTSPIYVNGSFFFNIYSPDQTYVHHIATDSSGNCLGVFGDNPYGTTNVMTLTINSDTTGNPYVDVGICIGTNT